MNNSLRCSWVFSPAYFNIAKSLLTDKVNINFGISEEACQNQHWHRETDKVKVKTNFGISGGTCYCI